MLNTYIKNQGITKTIIHENNKNHVNLINWDADYDGNIANISINTNTDGTSDNYKFSLDNFDLANMLNVQSVNMPIDERLQMDFEPIYYKYSPKHFVELPSNVKTSYVDKPLTSPSTNEELIIPLTINRKTKDLLTLTPHKKHKRRKSHITHKVYKKHKSKTTKSKTKSHSSTRKTARVIDL